MSDLRKSTISSKVQTKSNTINDRDRELTYGKIVDLLIVAGYFRARIQTIDPFDKILGGLAWTLTGSFTDIDIEFKDDMNLTEKIKISEAVIIALKQVNCPINLSPHQIQGLDLPVIYEVLQWSVKNLLETRDERNIVNKRNAASYFQTKFSSKRQVPNDNQERISKVKYNYIATGRLFRPAEGSNFDYNDPLRVYFTLIEHGLNKEISFQRTLIDLMKNKNLIIDKERRSTITPNSANIKKGKEDTVTSEEKKKLEEIISSNIVEVSQNSFKRINTSVMESIFTDNIDSIVNEIDKFDLLKGDETVDRIKLYAKEKERLKNNKIILGNQIKEYEAELQFQSNRVKISKAEIDNLDGSVVSLTQRLQENNSNLGRLNTQIKSAKISEEKMRQVGDKIKSREELKSAIANFKKDCLEEKKLFDSQLASWEKKVQKMSDSENTEVFEEIDSNYQAQYERLLIKKKDLFEQNKIINLLTRKIQLFPSKLELIQYQKRFGELYEGINNHSEISRGIMNELNSKEEVMSLLNQKLEMFVSLKDAYKLSKSKKDKENFKQNLESLLASLADSLKKNVERLRTLAKSIDDQNLKLNELQLYENKYMKLIKEYNKEYNKYSGFNK